MFDQNNKEPSLSNKEVTCRQISSTSNPVDRIIYKKFKS